MCEWKPVVGYETLYAASSDGDIKRIKGGYGATIGRILKAKIDKQGYQQVTLYNDDHEPRCFKVCRLIAKAFIPNPENKPTVNHKDGNKRNDRVSNLEWATSSEQGLHAYRLGLSTPTRGEANGTSIATNEIVLELRRRHRTENISYKELAREYGLSHYTIGDIVRGDTWKHI
jgi:NUMOD4 motif-containing protein/HNH endonuclease